MKTDLFQSCGHCWVFLWKNDRRISVRFQGKPFTITVIQVYAPTTNAKEAEVERFCGDLQELLELTPKHDVLFLTGDWDAEVGSQGTPGVTGKCGLAVRNEAGQRPTELCHENTLVTANTLFQQQKRRLYMWPLLKFPNVLAYWVQHLNSIIFWDLKQLSWNSITSTSFVPNNSS